MLVDVFQRSTSELVLAGVVVTVLTLGFMKLKKNLKIYKLGGRAAQVPSYALLFGISRPQFHYLRGANNVGCKRS